MLCGVQVQVAPQRGDACSVRGVGGVRRMRSVSRMRSRARARRPLCADRWRCAGRRPQRAHVTQPSALSLGRGQESDDDVERY